MRFRKKTAIPGTLSALMRIAPTGQVSTHRPQPLQRSPIVAISPSSRIAWMLHTSKQSPHPTHSKASTSTVNPGNRSTESQNAGGPSLSPERTVQQQSQQKQMANIWW
jgi:hypothetical protein